MVTVKRQVANEKERYGGYDIPYDSYEIEEAPASYSDAQKTSAETSSYVQTPIAEPKVRTNGQHTKFKYTTRRAVEDVMPTIRQERAQPQVVDNINKAMTRRRLENKTKFMLVLYLSISVALAAIVIATGLAISAAERRVNDLEAAVNANYNVIARQSAELENLSSDDTIRGKAYESGMVKTVEAKEIEFLPMGESVTYQRTTNWFDGLCDWISNLIGG